jgi:1-acyl-sn-glycerol-3-phosphate acyltransferase
MLSLGVFPKIVGSFPKKGTFIIMMNHSSFLDVFLFPLIPRGAYSGVTAVENFKYPVFSLLIRRLKAIPIERNNILKAIQGIQKAEEVLKEGIHIGILPEGTRTLNGKMLSLKKGGFHMAINTKTSIIPVGISGAFKFKPKNRWWIKPGIITINIGGPIDHGQYGVLGIDGLINLVESEIKYLSGENDGNR